MTERVLPAEIAPVFNELNSEFTWLHARWNMYRQLFAESERRVELLNTVASSFFHIVQSVLFADVQITLSKLTDPARSSGKHENLTIEMLHELVLKFGDPALADPMAGIKDKIQSTCSSLRLHRNKRLAHLDLPVALGAPESALPGVTRETIEHALGLIGDYMNSLNAHYKDSQTIYDHVLLSGGDGNHLVSVIKDGMRYGELRKAEVVSWNDLAKSDWRDA